MCHTYEYVSHVVIIREYVNTWPLVGMRFVHHLHPSHVRHDSFMCATWLVHRCGANRSYVAHLRRTYESLIYVQQMTRVSIRTTHEESCVHVTKTRILHMCDMTRSNAAHTNRSYVCQTWLMSIWTKHEESRVHMNTTRIISICAKQDSFICEI